MQYNRKAPYERLHKEKGENMKTEKGFIMARYVAMSLWVGVLGTLPLGAAMAQVGTWSPSQQTVSAPSGGGTVGSVAVETYAGSGQAMPGGGTVGTYAASDQPAVTWSSTTAAGLFGTGTTQTTADTSTASAATTPVGLFGTTATQTATDTATTATTTTQEPMPGGGTYATGIFGQTSTASTPATVEGVIGSLNAIEATLPAASVVSQTANICQSKSGFMVSCDTVAVVDAANDGYQAGFTDALNGVAMGTNPAGAAGSYARGYAEAMSIKTGQVFSLANDAARNEKFAQALAAMPEAQRPAFRAKFQALIDHQDTVARSQASGKVGQ